MARMRRDVALVGALAALLVLAACGGRTSAQRASALQGTELAAPTDKPDFVLTDTEGLPYDFRAETAGFTTILYFGYLSCPDICPVHLANIASVLAADPLTAQAVKVVFVSVDPQRDTPEEIREYLDHFDSRFVGLTGDRATLVAAQEAAGVAPAILGEPDENGFYTVGHAGQLLAYAPDGKGYVVYPFGTRQTQLAHDLPLLAELHPAPAS